MQLDTPVDVKHARFLPPDSQPGAAAAAEDTLSYDQFMALSHTAEPGQPNKLLLYVSPEQSQPQGQWLPAVAALQRLGLSVVHSAGVAPSSPAAAPGTCCLFADLCSQPRL
jgi:hypothetical protein